MWSERPSETNATSGGGVHGPSDESLVEAAKRGHSMAFATLSERYRQQLFRAAHRITRSYEDAEDAVQDSLLRAFVHVTDFDGRSSFGTWLTRIAINSALMILRKKRASLEIATDRNEDFGADGPHETANHQPNPEKLYAQSEEETMLKKAIQSLRPTLRVVVQLQLQERSMRDAAELISSFFDRSQGKAVPHQERTSEINDPDTRAPTSICQQDSCFLLAGQWLTQSDCTNTLRRPTAI